MTGASAHPFRRGLVHFVLPVLASALIGGAVGWGYPYAKGGRRLFSSRHPGMGRAQWPTWEQVRHGRIRNGLIVGGLVGLGLVALGRKPEPPAAQRPFMRGSR